MMGLTLSHRQKSYITSKSPSYIRSHKNPDMESSVQYPLISKKLTGTGGEKNWIT